MKIKLIGAIKVVIGLLAVLGGFLILYPLLQESSHHYLIIGNLIGFALLEAYGLYVVYSGWTEFQDHLNFKRGIIWLGVGGGFVMFLVMLWVIKNDTSQDSVVGGVITLGLIFFIGIRDLFRLKRNNAAHPKRKKQVPVVESGVSQG